jgi:hypothetical protein
MGPTIEVRQTEDVSAFADPDDPTGRSITAESKPELWASLAELTTSLTQQEDLDFGEPISVRSAGADAYWLTTINSAAGDLCDSGFRLLVVKEEGRWVVLEVSHWIS